MIRRAAAVAAATLALLLLLAVPASALQLCRADPPMTSPSSGVSATVDPGPEKPIIGPGTPGTDYQRQGYAGLTWVNYDLGCANAAADSVGAAGAVKPEETAGGWLANLLLSSLVGAVAAFAFIVRIVFNPATVAILDPLVRIGSYVLGGAVFLPALAVTGGAAGLWFIARSGKQSVAKTTTAAGTLLLIVGITLAAIVYPLTIGRAADRLVTTSVAVLFDQATTAGQGAAKLIGGPDETPAPLPLGAPPTDQASLTRADPADQIIGLVHRAVLVSTVTSGNVGRMSGPTAEKYGPCLLTNSGRTYAEDKLPDAEREAVDKRKASAFRECASALKDTDPAAYAYLAGHHNNSRIGYALVGWVAFALVAVPLAVALGALLYALVALRAVMFVLPLYGAVAVIPQFAAAFWKPLDFLASKAVLGAAAIALAAIQTVILAAMLSPASGVPLLTAVAAVALFDLALIGAWKQTKRAAARTSVPRPASPPTTSPAGERGADRMPAEGRDYGTTASQTGPARRFVSGAVGTAATAALSGATAGATGAVVAARAARTSTTAGAPAPAGPAIGPAPAGPATPKRALVPPVTEPTPTVTVYRPNDPDSGPTAPTHELADDGTHVWTPAGAAR